MQAKAVQINVAELPVVTAHSRSVPAMSFREHRRGVLRQRPGVLPRTFLIGTNRITMSVLGMPCQAQGLLDSHWGLPGRVLVAIGGWASASGCTSDKLASRIHRSPINLHLNPCTDCTPASCQAPLEPDRRRCLLYTSDAADDM
eukprot:615327-Rhodomonas_salina.4